MSYFWAFLEYGVVIGLIVFLLFHRIGIFAATPVEEIDDLDEFADQSAKDFQNPENPASVDDLVMPSEGVSTPEDLMGF